MTGHTLPDQGQGATRPQLRVLKTLTDPRGRAFLRAHASGDVWLELLLSGLTETVRLSTFRALERRGWIEEIPGWSEIGITYWRASDAGRAVLPGTATSGEEVSDG